MMDTQGLKDAMSDYSERWGDLLLIANMQSWLEKKMGGYWTIKRDSEAGKKFVSEFGEMLVNELDAMIEKSNNQDLKLNYRMGVMDAMLLIIKKMITYENR